MSVGSEVVQLYVLWPAAVYSSYRQVPAQQLVGFSPEALPNGEQRAVNISVGLSTFRVWDSRGQQYVRPKGNYTVFAGGQQPNQVAPARRAPSNILKGTVTLL